MDRRGGWPTRRPRARAPTARPPSRRGRAKIPLGRFGKPDEIAAVIAFLCSERAANVTGATWSVDGGSVPLFI